jgi:hypothetical protein
MLATRRAVVTNRVPKTPLCWYTFPCSIIVIHIRHQPVHTLIHTPPIDRTTRHDAPIPILQLPQPQRLAYLACALCTRLILLVREYEQRGVAQLFFVEHGGEFFRGGGEAVDVCGVDDEDYGGGVGVVAAPVGADGGLAAEVLWDRISPRSGREMRDVELTQTLKLRFL